MIKYYGTKQVRFSSSSIFEPKLSPLIGIFCCQSNLSETAEDQTFNIYSHDNMQVILNIVFEELNAQIELFEWLLKFKSDANSTKLLTKQAVFVLDSLQCLLDLDAPAGAIEEQLLRTLSKFYNFMIAFSRSVSLGVEKLTTSSV